jgi:cobalt/nickel transport system permease protein
LIAALAVAILLVFLARLDRAAVVKRVTVVAGFLLLIWLVLPLTSGGAVAARLASLPLYREGIELAARISLKSLAIVLFLVTLTATMPVAMLGHTLNRLRLPSRLVHLLLMTYRYLFVIEEEYQRLWTAIRIRGFRSNTSLHAYRTYAWLVGMLFVKAFVRAERVHQAMRCRGFRGRFYSLEPPAASGASWLFTGSLTAAMALLIYLEIHYA